MSFLQRNWTDAEKWGMGILAAVITGGILYLVIPKPSSSQHTPDPIIKIPPQNRPGFERLKNTLKN